MPTTFRVLISVSSLPNILAKPKSEILGVISLSRRTLLAFISLWMILYLESWWRYSNPRAMPSTIRYRSCQSSRILLDFSVEICKYLFSSMEYYHPNTRSEKEGLRVYRIESSPGSCFPCIHTQVSFLVH